MAGVAYHLLSALRLVLWEMEGSTFQPGTAEAKLAEELLDLLPSIIPEEGA